MKLHRTKSGSDAEFARMSRALIERAMAMRCDAYISHSKHMLLMQTIMNMGVIKSSLVKTNQQLKELDKIKTLFIASMTHELNNPLTTIIGYSQMVAQGLAGPLTEKQQQYLQNVVDSAEHLKGLVSDAMDVAKIESNVIELHVESFGLKDAIASALVQVRQRADEKGLAIRVTGAEWVEMVSDRRRLIQCLVNLLSNAVKYTNQGQVTIAATAADGMVTITVSDTGVGLSERDIEHLFTAFRRGGSAAHTKEQGSGIGLFLTNRLVHNLLQGSIAVTSELDKGSAFTITIPQRLTEA